MKTRTFQILVIITFVSFMAALKLDKIIGVSAPKWLVIGLAILLPISIFLFTLSAIKK